MKYIPLALNIVSILIAGLLVFKTHGSDLSAIVTLIGLIGAVVTWFLTEGFGNTQPQPQQSSLRLLNGPTMIYVLVIMAMLAFVLYRSTSTTIIGIKGNGNSHNQIQIQNP
jgi:NADH:ubiquinone oxidoreductase subunit 6 (subunit J)